jgi:hypothetical protein
MWLGFEEIILLAFSGEDLSYELLLGFDKNYLV